MSEPPTIVWDIDDVLNDLTRSWFETAWRPAHPDCRVTYEQLTANPPHPVLGITKEEYLRSLDRFRLSPEAADLVPDPALKDWFADHGHRYRHVALTARPTLTAAAAVQWLLIHFGEWFQMFAFVPSKRPGIDSRQPDTSKGEFLRWLGKADCFVDDDTTNCEAAEALGVRTFLVARPWNRGRLPMVAILQILASNHRT